MAAHRLVVLAIGFGLVATGAAAQSAIEQRIQNNERGLNQMLQEQNQTRQQQLNNAQTRQEIENTRNRPPLYRQQNRQNPGKAGSRR